MNEKAKLFVFDRLEVFIILTIMLLVGVASFTFGVKVGQEFTYKAQGFSQEERDLIELKSAVEEDVQDIQGEMKVDNAQINIDNQRALEEKFEKLDEVAKPDEPAIAPKLNQVTPTKTDPVSTERKQIIDDLNENAHKGKWTIQLGSYPEVDQAKRFADGFKGRGYYPIINEVPIDGKGIWFRVGLGVFDSVGDAEKYVKQEETLFQGQDYIIVKLQ